MDIVLKRSPTSIQISQTQDLKQGVFLFPRLWIPTDLVAGNRALGSPGATPRQMAAYPLLGFGAKEELLAARPAAFVQLIYQRL
jgi:hypothetical protein